MRTLPPANRKPVSPIPTAWAMNTWPTGAEAGDRHPARRLQRPSCRHWMKFWAEGNTAVLTLERHSGGESNTVRTAHG